MNSIRTDRRWRWAGGAGLMGLLILVVAVAPVGNSPREAEAGDSAAVLGILHEAQAMSLAPQSAPAQATAPQQGAGNQGVNYRISFEGVDHATGLEVLSYGWGLAVPLTEGGGGAGALSFDDLEVAIWTSAASPGLLLNAAQISGISSVVLTAQRQGQQVPFLTIELENAHIRSMTSGASDGARPVDTLSLRFDALIIEYQPLLPNGQPDGDPVRAGWNQQSNVPAE